MVKINTNGKDQIAGGVVYRAGKDGKVEIPEEVAKEEGLTSDPKRTDNPKPKKR